jgi:hypothetical protein
MVVVVSVIVRNDVVTSEEDRVSAGDLEKNLLVFSDGDIERLLIVLYPFVN